ncbi:hypothetical protein ACFWHQ_07095 [Streptomyces sp. NPDC060334]|uniref:hypothetical protein n=1 Tax=unclassified Streptomyces TaxID=2593676 RepID=UPI00332F715C
METGTDHSRRLTLLETRVPTDLTDALAGITSAAAEGVDAPGDPDECPDTRH